MALSDALSSITQSSAATRNRVDILLERLAGTDDGEVLAAALRDKNISSAALTKALWKEYGAESVKEHSVATWRRSNPREVNGL